MKRGLRGAARIAEIAEQAGERDLVICVMSGGGSALLPSPALPVTLEEKQAITKLLLDCGANIHEINAVRKHISSIKGGQLARLAFPATVIALLLSDVIGDDLDVIGSGPTAPDASTFAGAREILAKYGIWDKAPAAVRERIERGVAGEIPETPKAGDPSLGRTQNVVVGSNILAVNAAAVKARELGISGDGAVHVYRRRDARCGAHACGDCPAGAVVRTACARAVVRDYRRRDYGHDPRRRQGRTEPGICAGGGDRFGGACGCAGFERGDGWE